MNSEQGNARSWLISSLSFLIIASVAFGLAVGKQRAIADWWQLRNYQPPTVIAQIATQDSLTDQARRVFYVNHPTINDRASFMRFCPSGSREQTIVLGCYQSDQAGIFLLDVNDPRLDGVKQVTAAHEMLHAAYDRLSPRDRDNINAQLVAFYKTGLTDDRIKSTIDAYTKSEPKDVVNEMHSIFATEVATLPAGLEQYYKQYFNDRTKVTSLSARYQGEFTSRRNQVSADDAKLQQLKTQIDNLESDLKNRQNDINDKEQNLTSLRNSNNVAAYNAGVPVYNGEVSAYNFEVQRVRTLVTEYNNLVTERNAIATEEDQLVQSLSAETKTINN